MPKVRVYGALTVSPNPPPFSRTICEFAASVCTTGVIVMSSPSIGWPDILAGFIDNQFATGEITIVKRRYRRLGSPHIHIDKRKASGLAGIPVSNQTNIAHPSKALKQGFDVIDGYRIGEISHE
jgi:hypothetical protein